MINIKTIHEKHRKGESKSSSMISLEYVNKLKDTTLLIRKSRDCGKTLTRLYRRLQIGLNVTVVNNHFRVVNVVNRQPRCVR